MLSIKDIVKSISIIPIDADKPKNITWVIDESGSTGTGFASGITVLEKEMSVVYEYILKNIHNNYNMYSFETNCEEHHINVLKEEGFVNLPNLTPKGCTYTHLPLVKINASPFKPDIVILVTDGETSSSELLLKTEINKFLEKKIRFEIIAISAKNIDLNTISQAEENRIPGMDLVNYLSNSVDKLTIYNQCHKDTPYEGAVSSTINKQFLTFMGSKVDGQVHVYLHKLLAKLNEHKGNINWGTMNMSFKQLLSEIGKLLLVYFKSFPIEHYFVKFIVTKLYKTCNIPDMTQKRIDSIIKYGFECAKNEKPIMYTNFEQHVKEKTVKHAEFKTAIDTLNIQGTTLNSEKTICMPTNGACIINNKVLHLTHNLASYPKSKDSYGNIYFPCDEGSNDQAIRIAFRELCSYLGYRDSRGPEPVFFALNEMSLMFIKGLDLTSEYMIEMRKLAIIQTSMESMISKDKYDGVGLYKQWKSGKTLAIHYSTPARTHSSLYKDGKINPLKLDEPMWWALMMSMLGLFEEQFNTYQIALLSKGISNQSEFLNWMRTNYKNTIQGQLNVFTLNHLPTSVFTLEHFDAEEEVYVLKKHGECNTQTCYSRSEIQDWVLTSGCVWCHHVPGWTDFETSQINTSQEEQLTKIINSSSKLCVPIDLVSNTDLFAGSSNNKFLINMIGITGAGKSTTSKKIYDLVTESGGSCLIVNADKLSKKGIRGKQLKNTLNKEIRDFDSSTSSNSRYKVLVVDICNENGPSLNCFGFDTSLYSTFNFYPNFDKTQFDNYQSWCLRNVLTRTAHDETSLYWLNPESAGVGTCIKVHNLKTSGLKKLLGITSNFVFNENDSIDDIMEKIKVRADAYKTYLIINKLDEINLTETVENFLKSIGYSF
jgi:hypothetical protein